MRYWSITTRWIGLLGSMIIISISAFCGELGWVLAGAGVGAWAMLFAVVVEDMQWLMIYRGRLVLVEREDEGCKP